MMSRRLMAGVVATLLLAGGPCVLDGMSAGEGSLKGPLGIDLQASVWASAGEAGFQIGYVWVISELEYPMDGTLFEIKASAPITRQDAWGLFVRGRYAGALSYDGTSKDSDFLDFPNIRSDYSESDSSADVSIWDVDAFLDFRPFREKEEQFLRTLSLGFFAGYGGQSFDYSDKNLDASYDYGLTRFTVPGPVSTYKFDFTGIRVGARAAFRPMNEIEIAVEGTWIPNLEAEGDGQWLLRNYTFQQSADGMGVILDIKARCRVWEQLSVFGGVRVVSLIADKRGKETGNEDGMAYEGWPIVPQITAEYSGFEVGCSWIF